MLLQVILLLCLIVFAIIYFGGKYNERYWKKRGVVFYSKNKFMGVVWDFMTKDKAFFEHFYDIYKKYSNEPAVGIGSLLSPSLFVIDSTNIQHVMATDFNSFNHRGFETNEDDLLAENILLLNGKKWKLLRQSMSPLFTSTKLKSMYYILDKSAQDFVPYIKENQALKKGNAFDTLSTFCSAAIAAAVFGITTDSVFDSPFLKMSQKAGKPSFIMNLKFTTSLISHKIFRFFKIKIFTEYENFFIGAIKQIIAQRKSENLKKHDFADLCVSIQNNGALKDTDTGLEVEPTDELLAAQAFFFFTAGVEPTATTMFNALVLLGKNPEILARLQDEIDEAFEKSEGKLSYDIVSEMQYLDMVMNESMRIYPAVGYLSRQCVKNTILPVGNVKVDKGTTIFIPLFPLHRDEKFYQDPEAFNPERFSRESKGSITEKSFMPFGKGNRVCIGMRFAQLQAKAGMAHLLRNFSVKTLQAPASKIGYSKEQIQVRLKNVDIEFIERKVKTF